jgi:uncharacterized protein
MKYLEEFDIYIHKLKEGNNEFEYQINNKFFEEFGSDFITNANLTVKVILQKLSTMLVLDFETTGKFEATCDRCTSEAFIPVNNKAEKFLIVKIGNIGSGQLEEDEDIIMISENESTFNIAQQIFEHLILLKPMHLIPCEMGLNNEVCNKTVLSMLTNQNPTHDDSSNIDPRWKSLLDLNKLSRIKNKNK